MRRPAIIATAVWMGLAFLATSKPLRAETDPIISSENDDMGGVLYEGSSGITWRKHKWEFGFNGGPTYPIQKHNASVAVSNDDLGRSELLEEYQENHIAPPPPGGISVIQGSPNPSFEIGAHVFYNFLPGMAVGIESGFGIEHDTKLQSAGIFTDPLFSAHLSRQIYHVTPAFRLGGWVGRVRLYGIGGMGWYNIRERVSIKIIDPVDYKSEPADIGIYDHSNSYIGTNFGGGVDFRLSQSGSAGFELLYHRIYVPGNDISFVVPSLRLSYLF